MNRPPHLHKTCLKPMPDEAFERFAEEAIADYAMDNTQAGRWPRRGARARAQAEFERLLPQGRQTPDNHFYEIWHDASPEAVGTLWFAVIGTGSDRQGYLYDIRIRPEYRGRGCAKGALDAIDDVALGLGLRSIGLHAFSFNGSAQALYRASGYGITGVNMTKRLRRHEDDDNDDGADSGGVD